jgi:hypothetical protein
MNKYNFTSCCNSTNNKIITIKDTEHKDKDKCKGIFKGENIGEKEFLKIQVDNCLLTGSNCDNLLIDTENNFAYFIELKSSNNIEKGAKQLNESVKNICNSVNGFIETQFSKKYGWIVSTRCPISSNELKILQKKYIKNFTLDVKRSNELIKI